MWRSAGQRRDCRNTGISFFKFRGAPPPRRVTLRDSLRSPLAVLLVVAVPAILDACPICFQFEQGPVTAGMRGAVLMLMTVTAGVLTGFAMFIARFVRRAQQ